MKKLIVGVILICVALAGYAESTLVETYGDWNCYESTSLMDPPTWVIQVSDGSYLPERFYFLIGGSGLINLGFAFGTPLMGLTGHSYTEGLIYITDKMDEPVVFNRGLTKFGHSSFGFVASAGQERVDIINGVLADIMAAEQVQFRTSGIGGGNEDIVFTLNPEDTAKAIAWITEQVDAFGQPE